MQAGREPHHPDLGEPAERGPQTDQERIADLQPDEVPRAVEARPDEERREQEAPEARRRAEHRADRAEPSVVLPVLGAVRPHGDRRPHEATAPAA